MKNLIYCILIIIAVSCKKDDTEIAANPDTVLDEYPEWYTLKAPVDYQVMGVWGNYDKTILISTMSKLFRTTDHGRHWTQVHEQNSGMFSVIQYQDTLFTMSGLANQTKKDVYQQVLVHADNFSVDDGKTWRRYVARNPVLSDIPQFEAVDKRFLINPIISNSGMTYKINQVFLDGPKATTGTFETPGVITSKGALLNLPQLHQLQSLYLDDQQRLYIAATDAVCSRGHSGGVFSFCNSTNGRGVVYVSKKPVL